MLVVQAPADDKPDTPDIADDKPDTYTTQKDARSPANGHSEMVHRLNDDCLRIIFELLPQKDKFVFGQVCKQWRRFSFRYTKTLDFGLEPLYKIKPFWTERQLEYFLQNYSHLTSVCITNIRVRSTYTDIFAKIALNCPSIQEIDVDVNLASGVREGSLALLADRCPNLRSFSAWFCDHCDAEGFASLLKHSKLERLSVGSFYEPSTWLKQIHSPLRSLSLNEVYFDPCDLIEGLKNVSCSLKELSLRGFTVLTEDELKTVMDLCPGVVSLSFREARVAGIDFYGDWLLRSITRWTWLEELTLNVFTPLNDSFFESLVGGCPKLRKFIIESCKVSADDELTEIGLSQLARLKELTHLTLPGYYVTDGVLNALKNPKLKVQNSKYSKVVKTSNL